MEINKITIVGMGALGVMYGDFLSKKLGKDSIEFVASKDRIDKFQKDGMFCNGQPCDFTVVDQEEKGKASELLLFAVKGTGLESAIRTVRNKVSKDTIIMSLLNGISSEEIIAKEYGMDNIIHCIVQGMDVIKDKNKVTYTQFGQFCIGSQDKSKDNKKKLLAVVDLFEEIGMPYTLEEDITRRIWSKFMLNVGINQVVMIYQGNYGTVQKPGEARDLMQNAMKEVITVAEKENINIRKEDFDEYIELIDNMNPDGMPSMRQDGLAHRRSEVELFSGTLIALADKHKINIPVNKKIYEIVKKKEKEY